MRLRNFKRRNGQSIQGKKRRKRRIYAKCKYLCLRRRRKLHRQKREHSSSFFELGKASSGRNIRMPKGACQVQKTKTKRIQDELNGEENFDFEDEISYSPKPPRNPDFIVKNSTSESLIKAMEASGGEIFSVCEEARDSIYIVAGNYRKQGDDTETLNSGWCGEPIKHNRIVNGISSVPNPCISLLWMVQNDIIDNIVAKNKGSFIGSGFLGRFLYCRGLSRPFPPRKKISRLTNPQFPDGKISLPKPTKFAKGACRFGSIPTKKPLIISGSSTPLIQNL